MANEAEFKARILAAANDTDELQALTAELQSIEAPWTGAMKIRLAAARVKLRSTQVLPPSDSSNEARDHWLTRFGLQQPDGRPLYRYRVSKAHFDDLTDHLRGRAGVMRFHVIESDAALFVIWAAEWFRRVYAGGGEEWAKLGAEIGLSCEQAHWRSLADRGLKFWQIPVLKVNRIHHRLVAIARQGGFPLAALGDGIDSIKGWAPAYLERLVGVLLSDRFDDPAHAHMKARALSDVIPQTWANDGMIEVSAELACGIVRLRREAEAAGIADGTLAVAWLDAHHQDWRDELPMAFDDAAAQALLGGLMRARAIKAGRDSISVRRVLQYEGGQRREQLELTCEGTLASENPKALERLGEDWSRLRIYAAGALAQYISGELGVAIAGDNGVWSVRPSTTRTRYDVPFAIQADIELRGNGVRVAGPLSMPRGSPLRGGLLVLQEDGDGYVVEASGSGGFRANEVYLEMPEDWRIDPRDESSGFAECFGAAERQLVRVWGELLVRSVNGDTYLVRTGQNSDQRDRLLIAGNEPSGCRSSDGRKLICGVPQLLVGNDYTLCGAGSDGWWRQEGEREWQRLHSHLPPGAIAFAWRDRETGHIRATTSANVLPSEFRVSHQVSGDNINLAIEGWPGTVASSVGIPTATNCWRIPVVPRELKLPVLLLTQTEGRQIQLIPSLPQRAWVHDWHKGPITRDSLISLAMLHRYVARSAGRCELMADLIDRDGGLVSEGKASWVFDDELAMAAIRDDIGALLRPLGDIGARVKLNFNDSYDNFWYISEFEHELRYEPGGFVPTIGVVDNFVRVMARSLSNPAAATQDHGPYSLEGHRPIQLPRLHGDWLIYLKSEDRVLSRPAFLRGAPLTTPPSTQLGKAMAVAERPHRISALRELADKIARDPQGARPIVKEILDLALSLDGLPPATFDILNLIADVPLIGTLMLFAARENEVETVMRLADGLPFAWALAPNEAWDCAAQVQAETMFEALDSNPEAPVIVGEMIAARRRHIATFDPSLICIFQLPGEVLPIGEAANSFVTRSHDRIKHNSPTPFRPDFECGLPDWAFASDFWRALDAPVAAALAAKGRANLAAKHIRCIKDVARAHPRWFAEAYTSIMEDKSI